MGDLTTMISFLKKTADNLEEIRKKLDTIQEFFNNNFSNVEQIRLDEIKVLQDAFFHEPDALPKEIAKRYDDEYKQQEKIFNEKIQELQKEKKSLQKRLASANENRIALQKSIRRNNQKLDKQEEKIKKKVVELEQEINAYNEKIDELNTGFGIIINLFRMRKLQEKKELLLLDRDTLAEDIEEIRQKWQEKMTAYSTEEDTIQEEWNTVQVELSIISEKLDHLIEHRDQLVGKAAFIKVLDSLNGNEPFLVKVEGSVPDSCPRCKSENQKNKFFCQYCGERLSSDRKEIIGSLAEISELNSVYHSLQEGLKQSVSFLALIRGIRKGIEEFQKSVESVKESQDQYSALPKLNIDVPDISMEFSEKIAELSKEIDVPFYNLHPTEFSTSLEKYTDKIFTESRIEKFFVKMGDELNKTTEEQWG